MDQKETIKERLLQEGYSIINEGQDPPNAVFPDHSHAGDILFFVLEGSMEIKMNNKTSIFEAGDEIFFPARVIHSAQVGPQGCAWIDGERPA